MSINNAGSSGVKSYIVGHWCASWRKHLNFSFKVWGSFQHSTKLLCQMSPNSSVLLHEYFQSGHICCRLPRHQRVWEPSWVLGMSGSLRPLRGLTKASYHRVVVVLENALCISCPGRRCTGRRTHRTFTHGNVLFPLVLPPVFG